MHAVVFLRSLCLVDMAYSRMHLEIREQKKTVIPQTCREGASLAPSHNASVMLGTPQFLCAVGALSVHDFLLLRGSNLCVLETTVPLFVSVGPAHCWSCLPLRPICPSVCLVCLSVLLLPAYWFTNKTGPILHSMPSWPSGGVSVVATSLLFSLRAVVP